MIIKYKATFSQILYFSKIDYAIDRMESFGIDASEVKEKRLSVEFQKEVKNTFNDPCVRYPMFS